MIPLPDSKCQPKLVGQEAWPHRVVCADHCLPPGKGSPQAIQLLQCVLITLFALGNDSQNCQILFQFSMLHQLERNWFLIRTAGIIRLFPGASQILGEKALEILLHLPYKNTGYRFAQLPQFTNGIDAATSL